MIKSLRLICICLISFSALLNAADIKESLVDKKIDDQASAQLRTLLDAMNSLQGKFVQTTYDKQGVEQEKSEGEFMLMRPGKFYWKTTSPMQQLLVSNNKTIWLYDPDLETVNQREFTEDLQETPALLLSADIAQLRKNFSVASDSKDIGVEKYTLTPKVTAGLFQSLTLVFKKGQLSEFSLQDGLGQTTRCELIEVQRNKSLPEEKFYFIPPEGVEVLKD